MLKQALSKCVCGQELSLPEGEIKARCKTKGCGAIWELLTEGYWIIINPSTAFAPILPIKCSAPRSERYNNYPKSKRKRVERCD